MIKQKEKGKVIVGKTSAEVCVVNIQIRPKVYFLSFAQVEKSSTCCQQATLSVMPGVSSLSS